MQYVAKLTGIINERYVWLVILVALHLSGPLLLFRTGMCVFVLADGIA